MVYNEKVVSAIEEVANDFGQDDEFTTRLKAYLENVVRENASEGHLTRLIELVRLEEDS